MRLNIIGNGFDIYHGLPSTYYHFACFLIHENEWLYDSIGEYYNIKTKKAINYGYDFDYEVYVDEMFWSNFEKSLGEVDEDSILGQNDYDLGLENDDPIDIELYDDKKAKQIKRHFAKWVVDTLDKEENYEIIKRNLKPNVKLEFDNSDYFMTFNYTHVLEKIYDIDNYRINYVHGECFDEDTELIVGHGNMKRIQELEKKISDSEENYRFTQIENNRINEYNELKQFMGNLLKDTNSCARDCKLFYERIKGNIDEIVIYGMSLGDVDLPYFKQLKNKYPDAKWFFSYFMAWDQDRIVNVAENHLNLDKSEYSSFYFSNKYFKSTQDELVSLNDYKLI